MGMFLSITGVIGTSKDAVTNSLTDYTKTVGGGLEKANISTDNDNCCVIEEANGNTTVLNPYDYLEWDNSSAFISQDLQVPVFSFHIHDGDLWMYILFVNGEIVDQFNPIPDYWNENISDEEIQSWQGNAATIAKYISSVTSSGIEKYLVRWDLEAEKTSKAYPEDEFLQEDWQLLDFIKKIGLPYPLDNKGKPKGQTFKMWTNELALKQQDTQANKTITKTSDKVSTKPWWRLW